MEIVGLLVLVVGFIWFMSNKKEARLQRVESLENWAYTDDSADFLHVNYRLNFPSMTMTRHAQTMDGPGVDERRSYAVKVKPDGTWQMRLTQESYDAALRDAHAEVAKNTFCIDSDRRRLEELGQGNKWMDIDDAFAAQIDTAHKRYVHQRVG